MVQEPAVSASDLIVLVSVAIAAANAAVSLAVLRSEYYSSGQAWTQVGLVWMLPGLGAAGVGTFLWSQRSAYRPQAFAASTGDVANIDESQVPGGDHHAP